ncbi:MULTISPECIES: sugar phosphate isomerase/epimerase [unclassified Rhizobium]|uniref:sugar phosphate isomerase/epimerase family protein n=1 Tax=unclassified Rhizobium TaxID=2613769 RepID=UPI000CDF31F2|nr:MULTISPECIES: sugar phosphate isomerase/epimerase [Rhizobium]AVA19837.1 xylose isomerase domain-containing protein [Rhizobium sp. NXC24]UWU21156.1 sugar phosphate isomerase/epimerase [Rhizobium tropici]
MVTAVDVKAPLISLAFSTLGCAELELDEALALAARHGLDAIEIRALGGMIDLPAYFAERFGTPAGLVHALERAPVAICALNTSMRLVGATPQAKEEFLRYLPWAEAAGIKALRIFDGGSTGDAGELSEALSTLEWWRETARREGFASDIMVETHDFLVHPDALGRFLEAAPDCALLWDTHHTWRKGGQDPAETWKQVRRNTRHLHVKDSISKPSGKLPYTYTPPAAGEFPMAALLSALAADRYDGVMSLEWERLWHADLPPLDHALREARQANWWPQSDAGDPER